MVEDANRVVASDPTQPEPGSDRRSPIPDLKTAHSGFEAV